MIILVYCILCIFSYTLVDSVRLLGFNVNSNFGVKKYCLQALLLHKDTIVVVLYDQ